MLHSQWINGNTDITIPLAIREAVFNTGKDAFDDFAMNAVFFLDDKPVGTGRLYHDGSRFIMDNVGVLKEYRGQIIGDLMTRLLLYRSQSFAPAVYITAQPEVAGFFTRYGFKPSGEPNGYVVAKEAIYFPSKCTCNDHHGGTK